MKKILALVLVVVLALSFTACGEMKTADDFVDSVDGALVVAEKALQVKNLQQAMTFLQTQNTQQLTLWQKL